MVVRGNAISCQNYKIVRHEDDDIGSVECEVKAHVCFSSKPFRKIEDLHMFSHLTLQYGSTIA